VDERERERGREEEEGSEEERGREEGGGREEEEGKEDEEDEEVAQFKKCANVLDICNWLVKKPEILNLACQMLESQSRLVESAGATVGSAGPVVPARPVISISDDNLRLWDESVKCLFLRARNPSGQVLDDLIIKIFSIQIYTNEAKGLLEKTRKVFTDFRNKFNGQVLAQIKEYKVVRSESTRREPSQKEIKEYITEEVTEKFLGRQLGGANLSELKNIGSFEVLVNFIRESFRVSWNGKNLEAVKLLDDMTKDLIIPSRSGNNIVNLLNVS
jgi:hypothetical protein